MSKMKRILCWVLAAALVLSLAACGAADDDGQEKTDAPVLGVCIWAMETEYFTNLAHWLEEAGKAHGWEVVVQSGDATNPSSQVEIIENFITMQVDAIFINPINIASVDDALAKAKSEGIWIFGHNYRYEDSEVPDVYLSGDPAEAGAMITDLAKQEADRVIGDGKVVVAAMTSLDNENNSNRSEGMKARAKEIWGEDALVAENSPGNPRPEQGGYCRCGRQRRCAAGDCKRHGGPRDAQPDVIRQMRAGAAGGGRPHGERRRCGGAGNGRL